MADIEKEIEIAKYHALFDADKWRSLIEEHLSAYICLLEYITNKSALEVHSQTIKEEFLSKSKRSQILKMLMDHAEKNGKDSFLVWGRISNIHESFIIYMRQSIVVLASFVEGVITNFYYCVFCKYPERMYDFIHSDQNQNIKGKVDLKKILSLPNKDLLLFQLASDASKNAANGEYKSVLKRLSDITKGTVTPEETGKIFEIFDIRNKIVHELYQEEFDPEFVAQKYKAVTEFISCLETAAIHMDVPIFVLPQQQE